jgi:hypothetical protein
MESISRSGKVFKGKFAETAARIGLAKPTGEVKAPKKKAPKKKAPKKTKK